MKKSDAVLKINSILYDVFLCTSEDEIHSLAEEICVVLQNGIDDENNI